MKLTKDILRTVLTLVEKAESTGSDPSIVVYEACESGIGSILYAEVDLDMYGHKGVFRVQLTDESSW